MHNDVRAALRKAIALAGQNIQPTLTGITETVQVWRRTNAQQWRTEHRARPSLTHGMREQVINQASAEFIDIFRRCYPEYGGMVGFRGFNVMNFLHDPSYILRSIMLFLWERHGTFQPQDTEIDAMVSEFSDFIDQEEIPFTFISQLLNYHMDSEHISLPDDLAIRRLTEQEISAIYAGPLLGAGLYQRGFRIYEYAIEGQYSAHKVFGPPGASNSFGDIRLKLYKAILALRTFKNGSVGCESVYFKPVKFCPIDFGWYGFHDLSTPAGQYEISSGEEESLYKHAEFIFSCSESVMEMACSRLADAGTRFRPQDQLVDAVIGLEVILLAGTGKDDRRGELRFRFAMNYSTLFNETNDRLQAFHLARDLYDLRSKILHGGLRGDDKTHKVGGENLDLQKAAMRATETLRFVIHHFLPHWNDPPYKRPIYWERGYFGGVA
jgi:hypothetical protein